MVMNPMVESKTSPENKHTQECHNIDIDKTRSNKQITTEWCETINEYLHPKSAVNKSINNIDTGQMKYLIGIDPSRFCFKNIIGKYLM